MKAMDPLYGMKTSTKREFLEQMTVAEKEEYEQAVSYIAELKASGADLEREAFSRGVK
jgi:hypothetical protein